MELRPASGSRPLGHFRVQGRWTPRWPVLDGPVPNLLEVGRECQQPLNRSRQFRAAGVRLVQSASGTSQVGPAQGLVASFLRSRHSPPEDNPPSQSMSWISYLVGRFSGVHRWPVLGVRRGSVQRRRKLRGWRPLQRRATPGVLHHWTSIKSIAAAHSINGSLNHQIGFDTT